MKIRKNLERLLLDLWILFTLISCANIFLIPIASSASWSSMSVLDQYSYANRYLLFHQQFSCEVILCFEKEVTSFYRNYSLRNSRNSYSSVNCM